MGFKSVYNTLMDVFPQVDIRILRAVALEHSKDPDVAVETVISEILPALESKSLASEPALKKPEEESELQEQIDLLRRRSSSSLKRRAASSSMQLQEPTVLLPGGPSGSVKSGAASSSSRLQERTVLLTRGASGSMKIGADSSSSLQLQQGTGLLPHGSSSSANSGVASSTPPSASNVDDLRDDLSGLNHFFRRWDNHVAGDRLVNGERADNGSLDGHVAAPKIDYISGLDHHIADDFKSWDHHVAGPRWVNGVRADNVHRVAAPMVDDFYGLNDLVAAARMENGVRPDSRSLDRHVAAPAVDDFFGWGRHFFPQVDDFPNWGNSSWGPQVGPSNSKKLGETFAPSSSNPQQEKNQLQRSIDSEELILLHKAPSEGEPSGLVQATPVAEGDLNSQGGKSNCGEVLTHDVPNQEEKTLSGSDQTTPVKEDDLNSQGGKCGGGEVFFDTENEIPSLGDGIVDPEPIPLAISAATALKADASSSGLLVFDQKSEEVVSHASLDSLDVVVGEEVPEVNAKVDAAAEVESTGVEQGIVVGEEVPEVNAKVDAAAEVESTRVEQVVVTDDFDLGISSSQCNVSIEVLDEIIEAGKDNKRTLFSAVESVMNKMREVELKEKEAEQAEQEAATAGLDIQVQVEELKKMLGHAREANDMHAGEVYGEKAILSTEVKELQARVVNLAEERDTALAVLDEMHRVLEDRLAAAEELLRAAEKEKFEKEDSARKALAEQQSIMEKVVEESKILQEAAEENSKLREFLMDRGHVVDTLQGEISVICQDVRLLKEKIDNRVPLSESISSSQTSCILASSGSSSRTVLAFDAVPAFGEASFVSKHTSPASSVHAQSPRSEDVETAMEQGSVVSAETKEPLVDDDEWDLVENNAEMSRSA